ncbi:MAG: DNA internalization-related competence protein ComEC/Rec2 [Candidatus Firestonebacteria bacterium]|nr:DNA internalization-related competence protein ComEC/Rec2 [Candidatus Firestonebacteria bacterium]
MQTTNLFKATLIYIIGIIIGRYFYSNNFTYYFSLIIFTAVSAYFLKKHIPAKRFIFFTSVLLLGIINYKWNEPYINIADKNQQIQLEGTVNSIPLNAGNITRLVLDLKKIVLSNKTEKYFKNVFVNVNIYNPDREYFYGDVLNIKGDLNLPQKRRNPGGIDKKALQEINNITGVINASQKNVYKIGFNPDKRIKFSLFSLRKKIVSEIKKYLSSPYDSIFLGIMLGEKEELSSDIFELLQKGGIAHIISVSGLHIGILSFILYLLFSPLPVSPGFKSILNIVLIISYTILTGASDLSIRAAGLVSIFHITGLFKRNTEIVNYLWLALLITLLISPLSLFSAGLILSYAVTFCLICFTPIFENYFSKLPHTIRMPLSGSLAAQIGALPLTVYYFYTFSIGALFINLIILPLVGIIMPLGFAFIVSTFIFPQAASILAEVICFLINLTVKITSFFISIPGSYFFIPTPPVIIIISYFIFILCFLYKSSFMKKFGLFQILLVLNFYIWKSVLTYNGWLMKINFIDVGQGDAIFTVLPGNKNILVDTGPISGGNEVENYLRNNGVWKIDTLIITHADLDHAGGLIRIIKHFSIDNIYFNLSYAKTLNDTEKGLKISLASKYNDIKSAYRGDKIPLSPYVSCLVINPPKDSNFTFSNDNSLSQQIWYKNFSLIFTGDMGYRPEKQILNSCIIKPATVLKVSHHGSKSSTSRAFLLAIQPDVAVISAGINNKFGHPNTDTLEKLKQLRSKIYRTDQNGMISIITDGIYYKVITFLSE